MRRILRGLWIALVTIAFAYGALILSEMAGLKFARLAE